MSRSRLWLGCLGVLLLSLPSFGEGTAQLGVQSKLQSDTTLYVDIVTPATESIKWVGTGTVQVFDPNNASVMTLSTGQSASLAGRPAGVYSLTLSSHQASTWDVAVMSGGSPVAGRLFTSDWHFRTDTFEGGTFAMNNSFYVLVPKVLGNGDVIGEMRFSGLQGYDFDVVANNRGVDGPSAGRSVPELGNNATPQYRLYVNVPAIGNPSIPSVTVTNGAFGSGAQQCSGIAAGQTGNFSFSTNVAGVGRAICDLNRDGVFDITAIDDMVVLNPTTPGANTVPWDGKNNGTALSPGSYTCRIVVTGGEYHFIARDIETIYQGLRMFLVDPTFGRQQLRMFWNDDLIQASDVLMPNNQYGTARSGPNGVDSAASGSATVANVNGRAWGNYNLDGYSKGNESYTDTFSFAGSAASGTFTLTVYNATLDTDGDTLTDYQEDCVYGTNKNSPDSDGDTLRDNVEVNISTNPNLRDSDGDTWADNVEAPNGVALNTDGDGLIDALDLDSDNDCIRDALETAAGRTNPQLPVMGPNCVNPTPVCNTTSGTCVACTSDSQCTAGLRCASAAPTAGQCISAPDTALITTPANPTAATGAQFTFSSPTAGATFQCALDGAAFATCTPGQSYTALTSGSHTFQVRAISGGVSDATPASYTWLVDATAPARPAVSTPAAGAVLPLAKPTFSGTAEPGSTVNVSVDSVIVCTTTTSNTGAFSCISNLTIADGNHVVTATATDTVNNTSPRSEDRPFIIDTTAPLPPSLTVPTANQRFNQSQPTFSGTVEGGAIVTVRVDGAIVCTTMATTLGTFSCQATSAIAEGPHQAVATARDAANNTSAPSNTVNFSIDTIVPGVPSLTSPANNAILNVNKPQFSGTAEASATIVVKVNGNTVCTTTADALGMFSCTSTVTLPDGNYQVSANAIDLAGNASVSSTPRAFSVDTTAPVKPAIVSPSMNAILKEKRPMLVGTAEANSHVSVLVDGMEVCTATATSTGDFACVPTSDLSEGPHVATAVSTDSANNASPSSDPRRFIIDVMSPGAPVITAPTDGSTTRVRLPPISGSAEPGSTVVVSIDGRSACTATANTNGLWACVPTVQLTDDSHVITAESTDAAGNQSPSATPVHFIVDATAPMGPTIIQQPDRSFTHDTTPSYAGTAEPGSTVRVSIDGQSTCTATTDAMGLWQCFQLTPLNEGRHTIDAVASDAAGNTSPASSVSFTVDIIPPEAPVITAPTGRSRDMPVTFSGTAEPNSTVTVKVDGKTVCVPKADEQGRWSCMASTLMGAHVVTANATDAAGNTGPDATGSFVLMKGAPAFAGDGLGCRSTSGSAAWWWPLVALLGLVRRSRRLAAVTAAVAFSTAALAQPKPVTEFDFERVTINPSAQGGLLVGSADILQKYDFRVGLTGHYEHRPLVYFEGTEPIGAVVKYRATAHLTGAFSVTNWLELSAQIPVVLSQAGDDLTSRGIAPIASVVAMATPLVGVRWAPLRERDGDLLDLGIGGTLGIPIGYGPALAKNQSVSFVPHVAAGKRLGSFFRIGGELRANLQKTTQLSPDVSDPTDEIGSAFTAGLVVSTLGEGLRGELSGQFAIPFTRSPVAGEIWAGIRYPIANVIELYAVGGPGFGRLPGNPTFRVLAGLAYGGLKKPEPCVEGRPYVLAECPDLDRDNDGILNREDKCPLVPGIIEADGCPDEDGDNDGIVNRLDHCPTTPGLPEFNGCPAPKRTKPADTDQDGIIDSEDKCPTEKGPPERQGCPIRDTDDDGIIDEVDACPTVPGIPELKGCPDPDTDNDGVKDSYDNCKTEPGPASNQGCPEKQKQLVIITREKLVIREKVYFATAKSTVLARSFPLLEQVAKVLQDHQEIEKVIIEGHTDDRGKHDYNMTLSQNRAEAVRSFLLMKGVPSDRVEARGYGPDRPVDSNATEAGREKNRRVEFTVTTKEKVKEEKVITE